MILLRGVAVSIPAEFLHVFMYARTQTLHMFPQLVGIAGGRQTFIAILLRRFSNR